ncbi:hypothetical protein HWX16_22150 [Ochrobactrum intermedium]|uniref:hypothetical protein n=1 Tax=Brucella intermedia TaxID=94625 RepID=UPI000DD71A2D|nr:hypothetical protein [Brucella intermedia]NVM42807.1 hypothetical protein [Brucella intermedia]NVM43005.1 hypothetical protein [Brucella intermedia]
MNAFLTIIDLWPTRSALAEDIGRSPQAVTNMIARGNIPSCYWKRMVLRAAERGIAGVTYERLAEAAAQEVA